MENDETRPSPAQTDVSRDLVDSLVGFDEALRRGESAAAETDGGADDDSDAAGARACLALLERAFPRAHSESAAVTPARIGRFELVRVLGEGGFGVVYLARDPRLGRQVALKVPRLHTLGSPGLHERFLREARMASGLDHPHIVPILEAGEIGPVCYIASAYCEGSDLQQWLRTSGPVSPRMGAKIVAALAGAVHYSHVRGMLHRDIKPSNILLAARAAGNLEERDDLPFVPKLTDFGLARLVSDEVGQTGSALLGTPLYMAPEQTSGGGQNVGPPTDVYALGVILYELLTGRPPFQGAGFVEVIDQVRSAEPVPPSRLVRSVPRELETICLKCLGKEPEWRYLSADTLQADLTAFLAGRPIAWRPAGLVELAVKWTRRHPLAASLGGLVLLAVGAIIGMQWRHARELDNHLTLAESLKKESESREAELLVRYAVSEVNSAGLDLQRGDFDQAARRLAPLRSASERGVNPAAGIEPEWNYVLGQMEGPRPEWVFANHDQPVYSVAASADGRIVASGDEKGTIKAWDLETGDEIASYAAHDGEVRALVFSPDGNRLASGGQFHYLKIWNTADWRLVNSVDAHDGTTTSLAWHRGGRFIASGGRDGKLRLWDSADLSPLREFEVGAVVNCVQIADDGSCVWSSDKGNRISQWSLSDDSAGRFDFLKSHVNPHAFDLSGDGHFLISGWGFHSRTGGSLHHFDSSFAQAAVISPSGRWAATEGRNGGVSLWRWTDDPLSGLSQQVWPGHAGSEMCSFAATPEGARLIAAGHDGLVKIWRVIDCVRPTRHWLNGHSAPVGGLAFSPDSRLVASSGLDGRIRVYECETGCLVGALQLQPEYIFSALGFAADCETLFVCTKRRGTGTGLLVWRPGSAEPHRFISIAGIRDMSITPDGARLAIASESQGVTVWDTALESPVGTFANPEFDVWRAQIANDGRTIAMTTAGPRRLHFLDIVTGAVRRVASNLGISGLAFDGAGRRLAIVGAFDALHLIDVQTAQIIDSHYVAAPILLRNGPCFSPDGQVVAIGLSRPDGQGGQVAVWHLETRRALLTLEPYQLGASQVRYSNDGRYLATINLSPDGDGNCGIFLWRFDPPRGPMPASR